MPALQYYTPAILELAGFRDNRTALLVAMLPAAVNSLGTLIGMWQIDKCGRRQASTQPQHFTCMQRVLVSLSSSSVWSVAAVAIAQRQRHQILYVGEMLPSWHWALVSSSNPALHDWFGFSSLEESDSYTFLHLLLHMYMHAMSCCSRAERKHAVNLGIPGKLLLRSMTPVSCCLLTVLMSLKDTKCKLID